MPKVTVIIPAYNAEKYICEAIDSVLGQTFRDFELIVLNDCSRDGTEDLILGYDDPRLVYVKNQQNMGVAATLNRGLALAKGEYVARMDADDISLPQRLEKQVQYLDAHPEVAVLGTDVETFDENGPLHTGWSATDPKQMKVDLLFSCGLAHPSVMMCRNVVTELGGYDSAFEGLEDYHLWFRVSQEHGVTTLPDLLFRYRVHSAQVTKNPSEKYYHRLRMLKDLQLKALGIEDETVQEQFYRHCRGQGGEDISAICATAACFEAIFKANEDKKVYDEEMLKASFRSILLKYVLPLGQNEAKSLYETTKLVTVGDVRKFRLKQSVKKLLGR